MGYSEEDVKDWEQLPMVSDVITSGYFGAWLYYRDKRRDERVKSDYARAFRQQYEKGRSDVITELKDASVIFDGEEIYGSETKMILITKEKYNEIFNRKEKE